MKNFIHFKVYGSSPLESFSFYLLFLGPTYFCLLELLFCLWACLVYHLNPSFQASQNWNLLIFYSGKKFMSFSPSSSARSCLGRWVGLYVVITLLCVHPKNVLLTLWKEFFWSSELQLLKYYLSPHHTWILKRSSL